jgi:hypothetical protein
LNRRQANAQASYDDWVEAQRQWDRFYAPDYYHYPSSAPLSSASIPASVGYSGIVSALVTREAAAAGPAATTQTTAADRRGSETPAARGAAAAATAAVAELVPRALYGEAAGWYLKARPAATRAEWAAWRERCARFFAADRCAAERARRWRQHSESMGVRGVN